MRREHELWLEFWVLAVLTVVCIWIGSELVILTGCGAVYKAWELVLLCDDDDDYPDCLGV